MELLERLIEEARLHGRVGLERDNALAALEKAGKGLQATTAQLENLRDAHGMLAETAQALRDEVHESRNREQACIITLRDVTESIGKFVAGGRKKRGKAHDDLILAKAAAEKLVNDAVPF